MFKEGDDTVIGVNELHGRNRQRFTIAHELGHLCLGPTGNLHLDRGFPVARRDAHSSEATDIREIEANQFAAELLMPTEMILKDLEGHSVDLEDDCRVRDLAKRYKVSLQAMIYRLLNLGVLETG